MTDWKLYLAITVTPIVLLFIAVRYGWLEKGEAGLWALFVTGVTTIWHEWRKSEKGAQHPLSDDTSSPDETASNPHTTEPEPSYEDDHDDDHVAPDAAIDDVWRDHDRRARHAEED